MVQHSLLVSIERTFDTYLFIVEMYMYIYILHCIRVESVTTIWKFLKGNTQE